MLCTFLRLTAPLRTMRPFDASSHIAWSPGEAKDEKLESPWGEGHKCLEGWGSDSVE